MAVVIAVKSVANCESVAKALVVLNYVVVKSGETSLDKSFTIVVKSEANYESEAKGEVAELIAVVKTDVEFWISVFKAVYEVVIAVVIAVKSVANYESVCRRSIKVMQTQY